MLRALLLGVLSVTAIASCEGKDGGPAVQAGVAAGKVVELTGTVTATRGGETRTLTVGSEVSGDDEVATGADGAVAIVLAHNNATWQLTANKHGKLAESLAWGLAKVDTPAGAAIESTSAAGRHAGKEAATSNTTAAPPAAEEKEEAPAAAAQPEPQSGAKGGGGSVERAKAARSVTDAPPTSVTAPPRAMIAPGGPAPDTVATPPPPPPPPPPAPSTPPPAPSTPNKDATRAPAATRFSDAPAAEDKAEPAAELRVLATREREHMQACLDASTPALSVTLVVAKGVAKLQVPAGTSPAITACLAKIAAGMKPSADASGQLSIKLP